jgi:hypothetical protein
LIKRYSISSPDNRAQVLEREDGHWVRYADLTELSVLDDSIREALRAVGLDYQVGAITSRVGAKLKELFGTELKPSHAETLWNQIQELCTEFGCPAGMTTRGWLKHRLNVLKQWEEGDTDGEWRAAVSHQCSVTCCDFDEDDPVATVRELLKVHAQQALDPQVSEQARDLIESGRAEAKVNGTKVFYDDRWMTVAEIKQCLIDINDHATELGFEGAFAALKSAALYKEGNANLNRVASQLGFSTVAIALLELENLLGERQEIADMAEDETKLEVGQNWYVKFAHLPEGESLAHVLIENLTALTVQLKMGVRGTSGRFKISDVEFVELA